MAAFGSAFTPSTQPGQQVRTSVQFTTTSTAPSPRGLPLMGHVVPLYEAFCAATTCFS